MHVRQTLCPCKDLEIRTVRWQPGQAGRVIPPIPLSQSRSMNRRTAGTGARCPAPVSNAGLFSSARASRCWCDGREAARRAAAAMTSGSAAGSSAVTWHTITVIGLRRSSSGHR